MVTKEILRLYQNILEEILFLEGKRKETSIGILTTKNNTKQLNLIMNFLHYDHNKHILLERAVVAAIQNKEPYVIEQVKKMYPNCEDDELLQKIRGETEYLKTFMELIRTTLKFPQFVTFVERRMMQEISKYVIEQARGYAGLDK